MRVKKTRKSCSSFDNYLLLHDDYPLLMDHYLKLVDFYALIIDYLKKICVDSNYEHPSFSFRPPGLNRLVETRPSIRFPVGAKNLSPSFFLSPFSFRPSGLNLLVETSTPR